MRSALALAALLMLPAAAHGATPASLQADGKPVAGKELDALFAALAKAGSSEEAKPFEDQILALFLQSGSPSVDLLMTRAAAALAAGDIATAGQILDSVTSIAPDYAEGWHQRARLQAVAGNDEAAMLSLQKTVSLNPRQFQALVELAGMLQEYGNKAGALEMYRKAQVLDPNLDGIARHVRELAREVEGERI